MSGLEIVGAAALYVMGIILLGYMAIALSAYVFRKGGLEAIPFIVAPGIVIWLLGACAGLVLLGRMLA